MDQSSAQLKNAPGAVGALVCGIISLALFWVALGIPSVVLGIVALILAGKAKKAALAAPGQYIQGGARTGGFVCGLIGLIIGAIIMVIGIIAIVFVTSVAPKAIDEFNRAVEEQRAMDR